MTNAKEVVEVIVKAIVNKPEFVTVTEINTENVTIIEIRTDKSEIGKIIGKQGIVANAIRSILNPIYGKIKRRYVLEIMDDKKSNDK